MPGGKPAGLETKPIANAEFGEEKLDAMKRMKKDSSVGRLGKINCSQRRGAQACHFEGRVVLSYEMLKVLPKSG